MMLTTKQLLDVAITRHSGLAIENLERGLSAAIVFEKAHAISRALRKQTPPHSAVVVVIDDGIGWLELVIGCLLAERVVAPCDADELTNSIGYLQRIRPAGWLFHGDRVRFPNMSCIFDGSPVELISDVQLSRYYLPAREFDPDICYIAATSGSTGAAKLIAGSSSGLAQFLNAEISLLQGMTAAKSFSTLRLAPASFDVFWRDILLPVVSGGTIKCLNKFAERRDSDVLAATISRIQPNTLHIVPSLARPLGRLLPGWQPESLEVVLFAGEPLHPRDVRPWLENSTAKLVNIYGPSETTMAKFFHPITEADLSRERIPVGHCIKGNAAVGVVDGRVCYPGEAGEIYLKTLFPLSGYLDDGDSSQNIVINPLTGHPEDSVYRTGDIGIFDDTKCLDLIGRVDDLVKIRGNRVYLGHVEHTVRNHDAVIDCAAVVQSLPGDDDQLLYGIVTLSDPGTDAEEILDWVSNHLALHELPQALVIVNELPRNKNGKIDRNALAKLPISTHVRSIRNRKTSKLTEPIMVAFQKVLPAGLDVQPNDSFRALGGQSIHAAQLSRILAGQGIDIGVGDILRLRTPNKIAGHVEGGSKSVEIREPLGSRMSPVTPGLLRPVSKSQARFLRLSDQRGLDHLAFRFLWAAEVKGDISVERMVAAIRAAVTEQEISTLRIRRGKTEWQQYSAISAPPLAIEEIPSGAVGFDWILQWAKKFEDPKNSSPIEFAVGNSDSGSVLIAMSGSVLWSDGFSKNAILQRISHYLNRTDPEMVDHLPSYSTYPIWETSSLDSPETKQRLQHWGDAVPAKLLPPYPQSAPGLSAFASGEPTPTQRRSIVIDETDLWLNDSEDTMPSTAVFWAFLAALKVVGGSSPIVMFPDPNRHDSNETALYGCFAETLLIDSARISADSPAGLRNLDQVIAGAFDNALPFEYLIRSLYDTSESFVEPLFFPIMFAPQPNLDHSLTISGATVTPIADTSDLGEIPFPIVAAPTIEPTRVVLRLAIADIAGLPDIDAVMSAWTAELARSGKFNSAVDLAESGSAS